MIPNLVFSCFIFLFHIQWKLDLQKPHYTRISEYETGFKEISVPFNEKIFKIRKQKLKVPPNSHPPRIHFVASRERFVELLFFNIYVNGYVVINEHIPLDEYNISTLYDCFWGLEQITPFIW